MLKNQCNHNSRFNIFDLSHFKLISKQGKNLKYIIVHCATVVIGCITMGSQGIGVQTTFDGCLKMDHYGVQTMIYNCSKTEIY